MESLHISVKDKHQRLEFEVDESYVLDIPTNKRTATLKSQTIWGAIRGLETFSQLVQARPELDDEGNELLLDYDDAEEPNYDNTGFDGLYIPEAPIRIEDAPKFAHRGLMLGKSF